MAVLEGWPGRASLFCIIGLATLGSGCAETLSFYECSSDDDCVRRIGLDGGTVHCDEHHFCVAGMSPAVLCPEMAGRPGEGSLVLASVVDRSDEFDLNIEKAMRLAVDEINPLQGGASQPPLALHLCDTGGTSEQTLEAVRLAVERYRAAAILGPTSSGAVVAINAYVAEQGVLMMSPAATAISISSLEDQGLVWRTAPSDALQADLLALLVKQTTPPTLTKVDTLYVDGVYGKGLSDAFVKAYAAVGGEKYNRAIAFAPGGADLSAKLALLGQDEPSHALLVADYDGPVLFAQLAGVSGLGQTAFFATDSLKTEAIFGTTDHPVAASVLQRVKGTAPATPTGDAYSLFTHAYFTRYADEPSSAFMANAYDAAYLVAIAAAATRGHLPSGAELASGLAKVRPASECSSTIEVTSNTYLQVLQQIVRGDVCLTGASGPLEFDANGDPLSGAYEVWGIDTSTHPYQFTALPLPE